MKKFLAGIFAFLFGVYKYSESMAICYDEGNPIASYVSSSSSCNSGYTVFVGWSTWCDASSGSSYNGYLCVSTSALDACSNSGGYIELPGGNYVPFCYCYSGVWSYYGTGYQRLSNNTPSGYGTCNSTNSYRCAPYYYGSTSNGSTGCYPCPSVTTTSGLLSGSVYGPSSGGNGRTIDSCYMYNVTGSDMSGTWVSSGVCQHSS